MVVKIAETYRNYHLYCNWVIPDWKNDIIEEIKSKLLQQIPRDFQLLESIETILETLCCSELKWAVWCFIPQTSTKSQNAHHASKKSQPSKFVQWNLTSCQKASPIHLSSNYPNWVKQKDGCVLLQTPSIVTFWT